MNNYYNPVHTICGNNACEQVIEIVEELDANKVLLIAWTEEIFNMPSFSRLIESNKHNVKAICFNESNPTVEQLFEVYSDTATFSPEIVIAVGGGSVMDVGKSLCCLYGKKIDSADELRRIISESDYGDINAKWIGVPTTSGTGSEVTCWATIWDPQKNAKRSVESKQNYAYAAVVDGELTKGMPIKLAVSSALDAVAHAVESYWANGSNAVSKALALGAIRTIMSNIDSLLDGDTKAHEYMAQGSMIAGLAFSNTKTTACHSISYPLTMHYNIPHGTAVSMLIAPVMKINSENTENISFLLNALGVDSCEAVEDKIKNILNRAEIPCTLKEWHVDYDNIPILASQGITKGRADNNPIALTSEKIEDILRSIYG